LSVLSSLLPPPLLPPLSLHDALPIFFVTTALCPAYNIRWHIGFYPTTLLEFAIVATVVIFIVEALPDRSWPQWRTPFTWPAALFILAGLLSIIVAPDRRAAAGLFRAYIVEPIAIFFIA